MKSRKLKYFGHISRRASLEKDIMLGTMPGLRRQGGQRKEWSDDLVEWTVRTILDLVQKAEDRSVYQRFVYEVAHAHASGTAPKLIDTGFSAMALLWRNRPLSMAKFTVFMAEMTGPHLGHGKHA